MRVSKKNGYSKKSVKKHNKQRIKRGFSDIDVWDLHSHITDVIVGGTRVLADRAVGYPGVSYEDWLGILHKIADGFELQSKLHEDWIPQSRISQADQEKIDEAWALFREYYFHLWD